MKTSPTLPQALHTALSPALSAISEKVQKGERISIDECVTLYKEADLGLLGMLATLVSERKNGNKAYFNRNFHIEPKRIHW
jgi:aminodeoxyfutalosine synthase